MPDLPRSVSFVPLWSNSLKRPDRVPSPPNMWRNRLRRLFSRRHNLLPLRQKIPLRHRQRNRNYHHRRLHHLLPRQKIPLRHR